VDVPGRDTASKMERCGGDQCARESEGASTLPDLGRPSAGEDSRLAAGLHEFGGQEQALQDLHIPFSKARPDLSDDDLGHHGPIALLEHPTPVRTSVWVALPVVDDECRVEDYMHHVAQPGCMRTPTCRPAHRVPPVARRSRR